MLVWLPVLVRPLLAVATRTYFQPDEYFQSLEPAHALVFGYGKWTWEWEEGLRSPLGLAPAWASYWALKQFGWDGTEALIWAPKLMCGLIAAGADIATYALARRLLGPVVGRVALLVSLTSFFHAYALARSFSNSLETVLTAVALLYWPWLGSPPSQSRPTLSLAIAALAVVIRPSGAVLWLWLGSQQLLYSSRRWSFAVRALVVGSAALAASFLLDSAFYGRPTLTPLNFLRVNVVHSISLFYGSQPFHFYATQGTPFILLLHLPLALHAAFRARSSSTLSQLGAAIAVTTAAMSLLGHKEFRFLHPLLPLINILVAASAVQLSAPASASEPPSHFPSHLPIKKRYVALLVLNLVPALYANTLHMPGQVGVMSVLRETSELKRVGFLMPCHSTPWQSHLHRPEVDMWALGCEPPLNGQDPRTYQDESDVFYASPTSYLARHLFSPSQMELNTSGWDHAWPSHLVLFQAMLDDGRHGGDVRRVLHERGYRETQRVWNGWWHEDPRRAGDIVVYYANTGS